MFGLVAAWVLLFATYYMPGSSAGNHAENAADAMIQMSHSPQLVASLLGLVVSIAFFNYLGITVTIYFSATTRMVLDSLRTFIIWGVSIGVGWQEFSPIQVGGFVLLLTGTAVYQELVVLPCCPPKKEDRLLLQSSDIQDSDMIPRRGVVDPYEPLYDD